MREKDEPAPELETSGRAWEAPQLTRLNAEAAEAGPGAHHPDGGTQS